MRLQKIKMHSVFPDKLALRTATGYRVSGMILDLHVPVHVQL